MASVVGPSLVSSGLVSHRRMFSSRSISVDEGDRSLGNIGEPDQILLLPAAGGQAAGRATQGEGAGIYGHRLAMGGQLLLAVRAS